MYIVRLYCNNISTATKWRDILVQAPNIDQLPGIQAIGPLGVIPQKKYKIG